MATHSSILAGESQDGGAWWAAVCGVTQSRTRLKRPGLPGAPQDEAGLTRKFETSHVGGAPCRTPPIPRSALEKDPSSRRGLTPRGSLECNPEIPAFPGEAY